MTSPFCHIIVHKFSLAGVVIISQLIQAFAALLVGSSRILYLPDNIWVLVAGYIISGLTSPFSLVAPYSEIQQSLSVYHDKNFDPSAVSDIVSGLYNALYALGGVIGPIFGEQMY